MPAPPATQDLKLFGCGLGRHALIVGSNSKAVLLASEQCWPGAGALTTISSEHISRTYLHV
eukprot:2031490-Amphidinium_carterae.1